MDSDEINIRITAFHIVFFIFIVSNIGGCLTPIGDPPLFMGYLKGVPFWWMLQHAWAAWVIGVLGLLGIFYVFDRVNFHRAPKEVRDKEIQPETWKIDGSRNVVFLLVILVAAFIKHPPFLSELLMIGAAIGSYFATPKQIHKANHFSFEPIREVAWLFLGIFLTMVPALDFMKMHAGELGLKSDMIFFWLTGMLSGALDNAPTYLTFFAAATGRHEFSLDNPADIHAYIATYGHELIAISLGAVFFGALTYIGNGPNFMVKSIAEKAQVKVPSFFGYFQICPANFTAIIFAHFNSLLLSVAPFLIKLPQLTIK